MAKWLVGHSYPMWNQILSKAITELDELAEIVSFTESDKILAELRDHGSEYAAAIIGYLFDSFKPRGTEVVRQLKEKGVSVPIFMLSSSGVQQQALEAGATGYFNLSEYKSEEVIVALQGCLGNP